MATKKPAGNVKGAAAAAPAKGGADLGKRFEQAAVRAKQLPDRPDNDTLLRLYALYKQGSEGDVKGDRPGMFDFVAGAKYDAWAKLKGTAPDAAKQKYVDLVDKLSG